MPHEYHNLLTPHDIMTHKPAVLEAEMDAQHAHSQSCSPTVCETNPQNIGCQEPPSQVNPNLEQSSAHTSALTKV